MPEGPEIRKAADKVEQAIINKPILNVTFGQSHLKAFESEFSGTRVKVVDTYGKAMVTRFESANHPQGLNIYTHNQLYGRWVICEPDNTPPSNRQLRLAIHTPDQWALLYSASDIHVLNDQQIIEHPFIRKVGKDVLNQKTTVEYVADRLLSSAYRNRQLGGFLTEQSFVAGLGNYLRCDVLFVTGICPAKKPSELNSQQIEQLSEAILRLPRQSYQTDSITNDLDAVEKLLAQGIALEDARFWVFRRDGLPCYRCGTPIIKKTTGGQPCYICENCQR
jgi:endonuclease-8